MQALSGKDGDDRAGLLTVRVQPFEKAADFHSEGKCCYCPLAQLRSLDPCNMREPGLNEMAQIIVSAPQLDFGSSSDLSYIAALTSSRKRSKFGTLQSCWQPRRLGSMPHGTFEFKEDRRNKMRPAPWLPQTLGSRLTLSTRTKSTADEEDEQDKR